MEINEIVNEYLGYYPQEQNVLIELKTLLDSKTDIYNSYNSLGHITASGFVYSLNDSKLLMLFHKKLNRFLQPGGHSEKGDKTPIETAKREVLEETGITQLNLIQIFDNPLVPFHINSHLISNDKNRGLGEHYHHDFEYFFVVDKIKEITIDNNESKSYELIDIDNLHEDQKITVEKIKKIISNLL